MRLVGSLLFWTWLLVTSVIAYPIALVIWLVTLPFDPRKVVLHRFTCFWAALYTWFNPAWPVSVVGRELIRPDETYVMVSNHLSTVDIFVVYRLFTHFKWVSKVENFRLPLIGWNMRLNQYIELLRGDGPSIQRMFVACERTLAEGNSIMMFPEGTRSADGRLRPFKPGAFDLAIRTGRPLLVLAITGSGDALPKRGFVIRDTHAITLRVLGEIPADELGDDPAALAERVRRQIAASTGQELGDAPAPRASRAS